MPSLVLGSARAQFNITLSAAAAEPVSVDWVTRDGTALAGRDYQANGGTVVFAPGQTSKTVEVFIYGRTVETEDRVFYVLMTPPVNAILADEVGACVIHVDTTGSTPVMTVVIPKGEKGERGYSAYEIALLNGFVGTEAEWLASLRPSPEELAPLVAPLIDAGLMSVTAAGTEGMAVPDTDSIKNFAGRIPYVSRMRKATAPPLLAGTNVIPMSAFVGDVLAPFGDNAFGVKLLRSGAMVPSDWAYRPSSNELVITGAQAGDIPIAVQYEVDVSSPAKRIEAALIDAEQKLGGLGDYDADGPLTIEWQGQIFTHGGKYWRAKPSLALPYTTAGDWVADSAKFTPADDLSIREQLRSQPGADMIGFSLSQIYEADSIGYQMLRANPKRVSAASLGILPNTGVSLSAKFQAAVDAGIAIELPEGVYLWSLTGTMPMEGPAGNNNFWRAVEMTTAPMFYGAGKGKTIIRLMDGQSTDASPKFFNMLGGNKILNGIVLNGITFDANGANNKISPNRASGVYSAFNCAHMFVSGSVETVGVDARASNSLIVDCEFINTPGVTSLAFGARFTHPGIKGSNNRIIGCDFRNNGNDSADHSSIYLFCDSSLVAFCTFDYPTPSSGRGGPVCCVESFGSNNSVIGNKVNNYLQFMWIGAGEEGQHRNITVIGNQGSVSYRFLDTWSFGPQNDGIAGILIIGNQFRITGAAIAAGVLERCAVNLNMIECDMSGVTVGWNRFDCEDRTSNVAIVITPSATRIISDVFIGSNQIHGFSRGIAGGGEGKLLDIVLQDNKISDCAATSTRAAEDTRGIEILGANFSLSIIGHVINGGDLGSLPGVAIAIAGTFSSIHLDGNNASGFVHDIADSAALTATGRRTGLQARRGNTIPTTGTWVIGDEWVNTNPVLIGSTPNKYIIDKWKRLTNGTANVMGTDWAPMLVNTGL